MAKNELTGIERTLVISYLVDGNVPLTLCASNEEFSISGEQTKVLEQGIVVIQDSDAALEKFENRDVRIRFYFNKLALYFTARLQRSSAGLALVIPETIYKLDEKIERISGEFSVSIFYSGANKSGQKNEIECDFDERFPIFVRDDYKARIEKYLSEALPVKNEAIEGRIHAPKVIYADSQRIVFAARKIDMPLTLDSKYELLLKFPIDGPLRERKVSLSCVVENMFENYDCDRRCACANFFSVREEDRRFLGDKMPASQID